MLERPRSLSRALRPQRPKMPPTPRDLGRLAGLLTEGREAVVVVALVPPGPADSRVRPERREHRLEAPAAASRVGFRQ